MNPLTNPAYYPLFNQSTATEASPLACLIGAGLPLLFIAYLCFGDSVRYWFEDRFRK